MRRIGLAVALAVSLALAPPAASAQLGKVYRVGVLHPGTSQTSSTEAFRQALRELGYVEGQTLGIEWRWAAGNPERYPDLATDLVRSSVDVIVAAHGETALAAKRATQTIPIVVAASVDAVKEGLVVSLARPGGNVTGLSTMIPELTPKRFELLKEIVPGLSRVALLWNPEMGVALLKEHEAAARSVGLEPRRLAVRTAAELTQAFLEATRMRCGAIVAVQNPIFSVHRTRIAQLALHNRLPAISGEPLFAEVGGLLTYGPNLLESWRRSAVYVDISKHVGRVNRESLVIDAVAA